MKEEVREFKREKILDEAIALFARYGFHSVSIEKIATRLEVTKPFIYTYFKSKDSILEEIFTRAIRHLFTNVSDVFESDQPADRKLAELVRRYVEENISNSAITTIFLTEERNLSPEFQKRLRKQHRQFDENLARIIRDGCESGLFRVDSPMLASLSISGMVRWLHRWYRPDGQMTMDEVADNLVGFALKIVGGDAATTDAAGLSGPQRNSADPRRAKDAPRFPLPAES